MRSGWNEEHVCVEPDIMNMDGMPFHYSFNPKSEKLSIQFSIRGKSLLNIRYFERGLNWFQLKIVCNVMVSFSLQKIRCFIMKNSHKTQQTLASNISNRQSTTSSMNAQDWDWIVTWKRNWFNFGTMLLSCLKWHSLMESMSYSIFSG